MDASQKKVLIIVLVVVGLGTAGALGLLFVGAIGFSTAARVGQAHIEAARTDAAALERAATLFAVENPGECPTPESLVASQVLPDASRTLDPWAQPFRITCEGGDIGVSSAGPDRVHGTEDDVSAHGR